MFKKGVEWLSRFLHRHSKIARWVITIVLGGIGIFTAYQGYVVESSAHDIRPLIGVLAGVMITTAIAVGIILEIALTWFFEVYLDQREVVKITNYSDPIEFARARRDAMRQIKPGSLTHGVFCTSALGFFVKVDGKKPDTQTAIKNLNEEFFTFLATAILVRRDDHPETNGAFRLLEQFQNTEADELGAELRRIAEIFGRVAAQNKISWNMHHFDIRHLIQGTAKDYLVVEDHIFKVMRKTKRIEETQYLHIRSRMLAATYRTWLADLFEFGDGHETSKDPVQGILLKLKAELEQRERH